MWIKQGDAYSLPVDIKLNGTAVAPADIDTAEFYIGDIRKVYPGDVTYDLTTGMYYVPLTQDETFAFTAGEAVAMDLRVKFTGGDVLGVKSMQYITVYDATSEVEI